MPVRVEAAGDACRHLSVLAPTRPTAERLEFSRGSGSNCTSEHDGRGDAGELATVLKAVDKMIHDMEAWRVGPVVGTYTGPAILSGRASGIFFHEIFGHRVEGQRQRNFDDAQTFKQNIGQPVLAKEFSVYFASATRLLANTDLGGSYLYI
jgi:predicted Zn-dependent protease